MPGRVLIAEEQVECCQLFKMFLQRCGYEVTAVHDGMNCVDALQDGALPDVLILSWELPFGECEGVLDWLQAHDFEDMAIVVLTARMDADTCQQKWRCHESPGCRDHFDSVNSLTLCNPPRVFPAPAGDAWKHSGEKQRDL